jgi:hypothetical protein
MSIFTLGRPASANPTTSRVPRWLSWNPYRANAVVAPTTRVVDDAAPARTWGWNPYRNDARQIERQGEREGYGKGRRDEHRVMARQARRNRHPVLGFVVLLAAVAGVGFLGLAYEGGSFSAGGAMVDHQVAEWRADVLGPVSNAGAQSGKALQDAGKTISTKSQQLAQPAG